jgi:hypothetical protein
LKRKGKKKLLEETVSYPIYTENSTLIVLNKNNKKASAYASYKRHLHHNLENKKRKGKRKRKQKMSTNADIYTMVPPNYLHVKQ